MRWISASQIEYFCGSSAAATLFPILVRKLIRASASPLRQLDFPSAEGGQRPGWDGICSWDGQHDRVANGTTGWELSTRQDVRDKMRQDFNERSKNPLGLNPAADTIVLATLRRLAKKREFERELLSEGPWVKVMVFDSSDFEQWIESAPNVGIWFSEQIGGSTRNVYTAGGYWSLIARDLDPKISWSCALAGRATQSRKLMEQLSRQPEHIMVQATSSDEGSLFAVATVLSNDLIDHASTEIVQERTVVVDSETAMFDLCGCAQPLILIPSAKVNLSAELIARCVEAGHHVLSFPLIAYHPDRTIQLPPLNRHHLFEALRTSGIEFNLANQLVERSGTNFSILRRQLSKSASIQRPAWSSGNEAIRLVPLCLLGNWNGSFAGDQELAMELTGLDQEAVEELCTQFANYEHPPITQSPAGWKILSQDDCWRLVASFLTQRHLTAFEQQTTKVLKEVDEWLTVPVSEGLLALLDHPRARYSENLRSGLAASLALLAGRLSILGSTMRILSDAVVRRVVRDVLLSDCDWSRWASLSQLLPLLAEAAPDEFLRAIELDLEKSQPELTQLFEKEGILTRNFHTGLLWALEVLAWEPEYLGRVARILVELCTRIEIVHRGNNPQDSLRRIFLPWLPQTTAPHAKRISILSQLRREYPQVVTPILISFLPSLHDSSSPTARPQFRPIAELTVSPSEYREQVKELSQLLVEDQPDETSLFSLLDRLGNLVPEACEKILVSLENMDLNAVDQGYAYRLWAKLQRLHREHQIFASAEWAWNDALRGRVERICQGLEPHDSLRKHAWLFERAETFLRTSLDEPMPEFEHRLKERRAGALREIFAENPIENVMNQIELFEDARSVGQLVAEQQILELDLGYLLQLFTSDNKKCFEFALGYALSLVHTQGFVNVSGRLPNGASPQAYVGFAFACPFNPEVWDWLDTREDAAKDEYWRKVRPFNLLESEDWIKRAVDEFLNHGRPSTAVDLLVQELYKAKSLSTELVIHVLEETGKTDSDFEVQAENPMLRYNLNLLFEFVKARGIAEEKLKELELMHLRHLIGSNSAEPTSALFRALQTQPEFFVDCLLRSRIVRDSDDSSMQSGESQSSNASATDLRDLVEKWTRAGNLWWQREPSLEEVKLWIKTVRTLADAKGLLFHIDQRIGRMLAFAPRQAESEIVATVACQILNVIFSEKIESGMINGLFERRGIQSRQLHEGGQSTRALATSFGNRAAEIEVEYPRAANILRRLAEAYYSQADIEDQESL